VITTAEEAIDHDVDINEIHSAKDKKLVHMRGKCVNNETLNDKELGYSVDNCYRITRNVEMYQTTERVTEKK